MSFLSVWLAFRDAQRKGKLSEQAEKLYFTGYSLMVLSDWWRDFKDHYILEYILMSLILIGCENNEDISVLPEEDKEFIEQLEQPSVQYLSVHALLFQNGMMKMNGHSLFKWYIKSEASRICQIERKWADEITP